MDTDMAQLITLRHKGTGKYGQYPAHFADREDFEEYDPSGCVDCVVEAAPDEEEIPPLEDSYFFHQTKQEEGEVDG